MGKSQFAGPGKSFPINDRAHARLAIPMATRSMRAGNISASTAASIKSKARAKLRGGYDVTKSPAFAHGGGGHRSIQFQAPGAHFPMTTHGRSRAHGDHDWNIR